VIGWFTGFFGLFGLTSERDEIAQVGLNVLGLVFACASICCSFMLRPNLSGGGGVHDAGRATSKEPALRAGDGQAQHHPRPESHTRHSETCMCNSCTAGAAAGLNPEKIMRNEWNPSGRPARRARPLSRFRPVNRSLAAAAPPPYSVSRPASQLTFLRSAHASFTRSTMDVSDLRTQTRGS